MKVLLYSHLARGGTIGGVTSCPPQPMRRTAVWCLIFASLLACLLATLLPTTTRWLSFLSPNAPKSAAEAIAAELGATERADKFVDVKPAQREPTMAVMFAAHHSAAFAWLGGLAPNLVLAAALLKHRAAKKEGRVCFDRKHKVRAAQTELTQIEVLHLHSARLPNRPYPSIPLRRGRRSLRAQLCGRGPVVVLVDEHSWQA